MSGCCAAEEIEGLCAIAQGCGGIGGLRFGLGMSGERPCRAPGRDGRRIGRLDRVEDPGSGRKGTVSRVVPNPVLEVLRDGGGMGLVRACPVERAEDERTAIEADGRAVEEVALYPDGPKVKVRREYGQKGLTFRDLEFPQEGDSCGKCRHCDELGDGVGACRYRTAPTGTLEAFSPVVGEDGVCGAMEEAAEDEWDS